MHKRSHIIATIVAIATLAIWGRSGFHTGWTQTSIPVNGVDEFTGIEFTRYEDGFVAGLDVLAVGIAVAFAISAISFSIQYYKSRTQS